MVKEGYKQTEIGVIPEDWDIAQIDIVFKFLTTATHSRAKLNENGDINYIHYGDIHTKFKHILDFSIENLPKISIENAQGFPLLQNGDVIIADASEDNEGVCKTVEIKNINNKKAISGLHTFLLRDVKNNFVNGFKGYIFASSILRKQFLKLATGMKVFGVSKNNLKIVYILVPPKPEQKAIATALSDIDNLINSLEQLIAKKEAIKKATMQQLLTGKKRLKGFNGEWEEKKLGEIGKFKTSSVDKTVNEDEKIVKLVNYMDVYKNKHLNKKYNFSVTSMKKEDISKVSLNKGDILFTPSSETPDDIGHSSVIIENLPNTVYSYHLIRLRPKKNLDIKFSGYIFNNYMVLKQFSERATGSTRFTLSIKDFNETVALLPPLEEQKAIAKILSDMDKEIEVLKSKLDKSKAIKTGMMQELLSGRVRLNKGNN